MKPNAMQTTAARENTAESRISSFVNLENPDDYKTPIFHSHKGAKD